MLVYDRIVVSGEEDLMTLAQVAKAIRNVSAFRNGVRRNGWQLLVYVVVPGGRGLMTPARVAKAIRKVCFLRNATVCRRDCYRFSDAPLLPVDGTVCGDCPRPESNCSFSGGRDS